MTCSSIPCSQAPRALPNSYSELSSNDGSPLTATPDRSNHTFNLTLGGTGPRITKIVISRVKRRKGDKVIFQIIVPPTADISLDFRNGSVAGEQLLPAARFPSGLYTSGGTATTVAFAFVYDGGAWRYLGASVGGGGSGGGSEWEVTSEDDESFTVEPTGDTPITEDDESFTL